MVLTEEKREEVGKKLVKKLLLAFENGEMTKPETDEIARFLLDSFYDLKTEEELLEYLKNLTNKWPIFSEIVSVELAEKEEEKKVEAVENVENLLKENRLDEALKVAEQANS